jgi:hypothetical protein
MKVLGLKMTAMNVVLLVLAALGLVHVLEMLGVKLPTLEFMESTTTVAHTAGDGHEPHP